MQATILEEITLPRLPSASGVEIVGDVVYVVSDDAPFLYRLQLSSLAARAPYQLFETAHFSTGRIPRARKPDLECLTYVAATPGEASGLLVLGSGATAAREKGFWVPLVATTGAAATVVPLDLTTLYGALRQHLPPTATLNIEGAAATATELLLLQRGLGPNESLLFRLPLVPTLRHLLQRRGPVPAGTLVRWPLPTLAGQRAGFSGATVYQNQLFVTASVEDTPEATTDGRSLGSFVGCSPLVWPGLGQWAPIQWPAGKPYQGKVEGITIRRQSGPQSYELLLVTDDDAGGSTALVVQLRI